MKTQAFDAYALDSRALPETCGIYAIRNLITGARYVGKAGGGTVSPRTISRRLREHMGGLQQQKGQHRTGKLLDDFKLHGPGAFVFEVIELIEATASVEHFYAREQHWIDALDACDAGYNRATKAGRGAEGYRLTASQIERRKATLALPEVTARKAASARAAYADPELRAAVGAKSRSTHARPDVRARHQAGSKLAAADPAERARKAAAALRVMAEKRAATIASLRIDVEQFTTAGRLDVAKLKAAELAERELIHALLAAGADRDSRPVLRAGVHASMLAARCRKLLATNAVPVTCRLWGWKGQKRTDEDMQARVGMA